ncbi:DUF5330 domain-containing protein [Xanthobacter autotrophicus]|jgi:hypothetical protein|uniref:DUF5330 domain-containing protein n=1 Tax=Xanthobacter autotrophicus TaxID=280 RepID=A0A6C1KUS6_XANAU|nr:DUF5330 domain-containing protein [Xanthobacter autotrophicus]TLX42963.1 hypothetical protein FBQ73_09920 [Xanthobacter autotrophicus]
MFFLLRLAFWLGLVLLLLPLGLKGTDGKEVSVFDAFGAAQALVADLKGFCDRQPQACAVGGQMASHLVEKAQVGAKWLHDSIGSSPSGEAPHPPAGVPGSGQAGGLDLAPQDLLPVWGGGENARTFVPQGVQPGAPALPASPAPTPLPPRRPA